MTNPIDPKRLAKAVKAFEDNHSSCAGYKRLIEIVLEADDQWRRDHPQCVRISYEWPDGVGWTIKHSMQQAPAPHDAAKEVSPTGITPSANPTSGGKVEQDAADEEREPELPPKWRFGDYGHKKAYWYTPEGDDLTYTHADAHVEVNRCDAHELEAIARHMRYRKRLQDKREKEVEVTDAMVDAAMNVPLRSDDTCADVIRRRLEAALNCRDEADGEGK